MSDGISERLGILTGKLKDTKEREIWLKFWVTNYE
jgi:hypothetical protein